MSNKVYFFDKADFSKSEAASPLKDGWGVTANGNGSSLVVSDGSDRLYWLDPTTLAVQQSVQVRGRGCHVPALHARWCGGVEQVAESLLAPRASGNPPGPGSASLRQPKWQHVWPTVTEAAPAAWSPAATGGSACVPQVTDQERSIKYLNELEWVEGEIWANVWQTECIARIDPKNGNVRCALARPAHRSTLCVGFGRQELASRCGCRQAPRTIALLLAAAACHRCRRRREWPSHEHQPAISGSGPARQAERAVQGVDADAWPASQGAARLPVPH